MLEKLLGKFGYIREVDYCKDCRQVRHFKAKRLDDLEEALGKVPAGAQFGGAVLVEEEGKIGLLELTSKAQAVEVIARARKGEIRLVF